jgi:hypothetical protein
MKDDLLAHFAPRRARPSSRRRSVVDFRFRVISRAWLVRKSGAIDDAGPHPKIGAMPDVT